MLCMRYPSIDSENARFFFKEISDRNNTMLTIMHQYTGLIIVLVIGIWTITFTSKNHLNLIFFSICISIILLLIWRYHAHYIDNHISESYKRLVFYEYALSNFQSTPMEKSMFNKFLTEIPYWKEYNEKIGNSMNEWGENYKHFCYLVDKKRIGFRGQNGFDVVAALTMIILYLYGLYVMKYDLEFFSLLSLIYFLFGVLILSLFIYLVFCYSQRNLTIEEIRNSEKYISDKWYCKIMSRLKTLFFPHGSESVGSWGLGILGLVTMGLGSYLLINGDLFVTVPTTFSLINSAGFFLMSIGLVLLIFAFNHHISIGTKKNMLIITDKLEEITSIIQKNKKE